MSYEDDIRALSPEAAQHALIIINREVHAEANRRRWCADFDDFIERVNREAGLTALSPRRPQRKRVRTVVEFDVDPDYYPGDQSDWREIIGNQAGEYEDSIENLSVSSIDWPVIS